MSRFAIGTLVKARGREWVVLPESQDDLVMLRPLAGVTEEVTGIVPDLEPIEPAVFTPPDPTHTGDHRSCGLLRDAVRLGVRNSAGPFRSFGSIAVTPRPYQLVPLLVALKQPKARVVCIALGHDEHSHDHPAYQKLLLNSLSWVSQK